MSFFGMKKPSSAEKIAAAETEAKMMIDMHNRMGKVCQAKCIPNDYREGELNKGESVCLDRCVTKFFETHQKIAEMMQDQQAQAQQARGGAGGFGFGG